MGGSCCCFGRGNFLILGDLILALVAETEGCNVACWTLWAAEFYWHHDRAAKYTVRIEISRYCAMMEEVMRG